MRPLGCFYWSEVWTLAAWCEVREGFRNFRVDRIELAVRRVELAAPPERARDLRAQREIDVVRRVVQPLASTGREVDPLDLLDDQAAIIAGAGRPVC